MASRLMSMFRRGSRRRRPERIDPFGVGEPWRRFVQNALQAQARYRRVVDGVASGPLRVRLDDIGRRIEQAAQECWRVAQRGDALDDAVSMLDEGGPKVRLAAMVTEAREQLARLEAALSQAVAGAVELSARSVADAGIDGLDADLGDDLGGDVDRLVEEIAALRAALDEVSAPEA